MSEDLNMDHRTTEAAPAPIVHHAVPMLDLQQFCSEEPYRFNLHKPFSDGEFSYATDGIVAIRVARRDAIAATADAKLPRVLEKYFALMDKTTFTIPSLDLPNDQETETQSACSSCDGRGKEHECPDCTCTCDDCHGSGVETSEETISVDRFGRIFRLKYLRQVLALPGIEVEESLPSVQPVLFRFHGGVGCLMPCARKLNRHIEIGPSKDASIT